jgi:hypothetical protein
MRQLVANKQVYEEIPPVLVLSQHPIKIKISIGFVKQITHTNEIESNI